MSIRKQKSSIPRFKSRAEEADFWDNHDSADFEDEFKEVEIKFAQPMAHVIEIDLDAASLDSLRALAKSLGVGSGELARKWLLERIRLEYKSSSRTP